MQNLTLIQGLLLNSNNNNKRSIVITKGIIIPNNFDSPLWDSNYIYINEKDFYLEIPSNNTNNSTISYIVAKAGLDVINNYSKNIDFYVKEFPQPANRNTSTEDIEPEFPDNLIDGEILIGVVLNENVSINTVIKSISVNETNTQCTTIQPSELRKREIEKIKQWDIYNFYIKKSIVVSDNILYQCKLTHISSNSFDDDFKYYWNVIGNKSELDIEQIVIDLIEQYANNTIPSKPIGSIQLYNENNNIPFFDSNPNLKWIGNKLIINGSIELKNNLIYIEDDNSNYKIKLRQNNRDYIISGYRKVGVV
jgi:hypothetical protein